MNNRYIKELEYNIDMLDDYDYVNKKTLKNILDDIDFNFVTKKLNKNDCEIINSLGWDIVDVIDNKERFKKIKLIIDRFINENQNLLNWKISEIPYPNTYILFPVTTITNKSINTFIDIHVENNQVRIFYNDDYKHVTYNMFEANTINEAINNFNMFDSEEVL